MIGSEISLDRLRLKLSRKVRYHLGDHCPCADDLVLETLARFFRTGRRPQLQTQEELGTLLNEVCRGVILEYVATLPATRQQEWMAGSHSASA